MRGRRPRSGRGGRSALGAAGHALSRRAPCPTSARRVGVEVQRTARSERELQRQRIPLEEKFTNVAAPPPPPPPPHRSSARLRRAAPPPPRRLSSPRTAPDPAAVRGGSAGCTGPRLCRPFVPRSGCHLLGPRGGKCLIGSGLEPAYIILIKSMAIYFPLRSIPRRN